MVYPEKLYEDYKEGNSIEDMASFIAGAFEAGSSERFSPEQLKDWEETKDRVVLQVIGKEKKSRADAEHPLQGSGRYASYCVPALLHSRKHPITLTFSFALHSTL